MSKLLLRRFFGVGVVRRRCEMEMNCSFWKKQGGIALMLGCLLCLLVPAVRAQEASGDGTARTTSETSGTAETPGCIKKIVQNDSRPLCLADKIDSLRLDWAGRFARGFQYEFKTNQQLKTVLVSSGSTTTLTRNPQNYLQQHTVNFKFAELFPDKLILFKRGIDYIKQNPKATTGGEELSNIFCKGKPLITCLAKGGSWWQRALMGASVNINISERTIVQQQIVALPREYGQKYQVNPGFVFDPSKIFITASGWKNAFDEVQKVDKSLALVEASDVVKGRKPWKNTWAFLIPKVELKVLNQFDYVKYQGLLIEAPFSERALNNWTFTWDLTRAIPDTKSRIDADAIAEAIDDLKNNLGIEPPTPSKWEKQCHLYFSDKGKTTRIIRGINPVLFTANSCQKVAKAMNAEKYQLYCGLKDNLNEREFVTVETDALKPPGKIPENNKCGWKEQSNGDK